MLVRLAAAGVNRPEVLQRMGLYPPPPGASDIPGLEGAGVVAEVGDKVSVVSPGDRICALFTGGSYGEYALVNEGSTLPVPDGLSFEEAASLPETYFTVWANVFDDAGLRNDETLLVHGGTSGIGVAAIELARATGARVIATASSEEKLAAIRELGAAEAFNYATEKWEEKIAELGGADVVLDMAGGDYVNRNLNAMNEGGRHVSIAFLRGATAEINIMTIMRKRLRLSGSTMKSRSMEEKARLADALEAHVWPLFAKKEILPRIDSVFPLNEAGKAHERMEKGDHVGKIVLKIAEL